ncbi:MAG: protein kinase family protein [Pseudanabaenaceae cyanobacterium bins.39]|nr:protein kinase family protein [Pseudanabaenaceae cyanobacterium bins.39]
MTSNQFPETDFTILDYLDQNTYLVDLANTNYANRVKGDRAVLKRFLFANDADWYGIEAVQQEIARLKQLTHPRIPAYIDAIATENGFCVLREYVEGQPISWELNLSADQIYQIAIDLLNIITYLQQLETPIFHNNIKPQNLIIDDNQNIYLTDFAFTYRDFTTKEILAKRYYFASPEYWQNKSLHLSSDLYSIGVILIAWLLKTPVNNISQLYEGDRLVFDFADAQIGEWLQQMVKPTPRYRFPSAQVALEALTNITNTNIEIPPKVFLRLEKRTYRLSNEDPLPIILRSSVYGDIVSIAFTVSNPQHTAELRGTWQIKPADDWISIEPTSFTGNETKFVLQADTQNLQEKATYERQIELHTNGDIAIAYLTIKVETANFFDKPKKWLSVGATGIIFLCAFWLSVIKYNLLMTIILSIFFIPALKFEFLTFTTAVASAGTWVLASFFTAVGVSDQIGYPLSAISSLVLLMSVSMYLLREALAVNVPLPFPILTSISATLSGLGLGLIYKEIGWGWLIFVPSLGFLWFLLLFPDWKLFRKMKDYQLRLPLLIKP